MALSGQTATICWSLLGDLCRLACQLGAHSREGLFQAVSPRAMLHCAMEASKTWLAAPGQTHRRRQRASLSRCDTRCRSWRRESRPLQLHTKTIKRGAASGLTIVASRQVAFNQRTDTRARCIPYKPHGTVHAEAYICMGARTSCHGRDNCPTQACAGSASCVSSFHDFVLLCCVLFAKEALSASSDTP